MKMATKDGDDENEVMTLESTLESTNMQSNESMRCY